MGLFLHPDAQAYICFAWVVQENTGQRVHWSLAQRRRRDWTALWRLLTDLLPVPVVRDLRAGGGKGGGRRRVAAVVFADLVGYTALWHGLERRHAGDPAARRAAEKALVVLLHGIFSAFDDEVARRPGLYKVCLRPLLCLLVSTPFIVGVVT
jgi:class 3 adenylate cyclase